MQGIQNHQPIEKNVRKNDGENVFWNGIRSFLSLIAILLIFFAYEMGNRNFADPDEGRYVEIPREMVVTGDFVTPKLNGLKYFEKPPLFYWMQAGVIKVFGINEVSMRLWTVIFAVLGCLSVFFVGARFFSNSVGLISSGVLATNILYYAHSRIIILDLVTSVLISGVLWCFFIVFVRNSSFHRKKILNLMYALSALACLTKGLIGAVLPGIIIFSWIVFAKKWNQIKEMLSISGILLFLLIFLPWHIMMALRHSDFLHFYFIVEHFQRYISTVHNRYQPCWFFVPILLVGLLPWTGFSLVAIKNSFKKSISQNSDHTFFICWIAVVFLFFSFSHSKLIPYILPILPPISLITGITLADALNYKNSRDFKIGIFSNLALFLAAFIAYFFAKKEIMDVLQDQQAVLLVNILCGLLIVGAIVLLLSFFNVSKILIVMLYTFIGANLMWTINHASVFYQETKKPTTKQLADIIRINKRDDDLVFCYKRYYQDFPVYLNSTVGVVDFVGELEFGAKSDVNNAKLLTEDQFWKLWSSSDKRIFLLLSQEHYRKVFSSQNPTHRILDFNKYFVVIMNK